MTASTPPGLFPLLTTLMIATACGGGGGDSDVGADATPPADAGPSFVDADISELPAVEATSCRFEVPATLGTEGVQFTCGDLHVEEDRDRGTGVIQVHFLRIPGEASSSAATIYLDGGPGGNGGSILGWLAYRPDLLPGILAQGDLLVIAQRGTNLSRPSLLCETTEECLAAYGEDVELPAFNSAYNADDVDDLRAALGYEKLNLYGISYGSRLGLEVLRRHGSNVRAAVLGGLVPSSVDWMAAVPASFYSALTGLDAACADDGGCAAAFGDLESKLVTGVAALDETPVSFEYDGQTVFVDGATYANSLFSLLYSNSSYPWLPMLISDLAQSRTDRISEFLGSVLTRERPSSVARGMYNAVVCGELYNPPDNDAVAAANANVPSDILSIYSGSWEYYLDLCATWPKHGLAAGLRQPVAYDGPVLLASGRLDPITPPGFGDVAAETLPGATHVVFERSGHGATLQSQCGNQVLHAFLAAPDQPVDNSCAAAIEIDFVLPGAATAPPVPIDQIRLELAQAPLPHPIREQLRRAVRPAR